MSGPTNMPPPGLDGTYRDSCSVCMRGTDTALALTGEAEWVIAGLTMFGLSADVAGVMVSDVTGCDVGMVPAGEVTVFVKLCRDCARASKAGGADVGPITGDVPHYGQPKGTP